jgi:hypothetical protein
VPSAAVPDSVTETGLVTGVRVRIVAVAINISSVPVFIGFLFVLTLLFVNFLGNDRFLCITLLVLHIFLNIMQIDSVGL